MKQNRIDHVEDGDNYMLFLQNEMLPILTEQKAGIAGVDEQTVDVIVMSPDGAVANQLFRADQLDALRPSYCLKQWHRSAMICA